jgi:hypothetical protein
MYLSGFQDEYCTPNEAGYALEDPYKILDRDLDRYYILRPETGIQEWVHVKLLKEFICPPNVDPEKITIRDANKFFVNSVLKHKGTKAHKSKLQFLIKWEDPAEENSWEPWKEMSKNVIVHNYLRSIKWDNLIPMRFQLQSPTIAIPTSEISTVETLATRPSSNRKKRKLE